MFTAMVNKLTKVSGRIRLHHDMEFSNLLVYAPIEIMLQMQK